MGRKPPPWHFWLFLAILSIVGSSCRPKSGTESSNLPEPGRATWTGALDLPELERRQFDSIVNDKSFLKKKLPAQREALRQVPTLIGLVDHILDDVVERIHLQLVPGLKQTRFAGNSGDELHQLRAIAGSGNPFAQYYLGNAVARIERDNLDSALLANLGIFSHEKITRWFQAAEQGLTDAQIRLGFVYFAGEDGVSRDPAEWLHWYRKAASQGCVYCQFALGVAYRAASQGHRDSRGWDYRGLAPRDYPEALFWFRKAAAQGFTESEEALAEMYHNGEGVLQDHDEEVSWYRKAATGSQGWAGEAKYHVGLAYESGEGVAKDFVLAYMWFNLAAADKLDLAAQSRDRLAQKMSREQVAQAQELTQKWKPSGNTADSTGTGFFVGGTGYLVTNFHVIEGCSAVKTRTGALTIVGRDERNDLAVLKAAQPVAQFAVLSGGPLRIGQFAMVVGYPLRGLLSSGANVTTGNVSALAGPNDDTRLVQITAPVQPGNSGGPLLDQSGNVIGVVVSKLDTIKIARATGDIPQNINFAIKVALVRSFLEAHGVEFSTSTSTAKVEPSVIAEQAGKATVVVECWK